MSPKTMTSLLVLCLLFQNTIQAKEHELTVEHITKNLIGKDIEITTIHGEKHKGKLVEIKQHTIIILRKKSTEKISLNEISNIKDSGNHSIAAIVTISFFFALGLLAGLSSIS